MTSNTSFTFGSGGGLSSFIQPSTNFGASTTTAPSTGFNFGQPATTASTTAPSTGFSFGQTTAPASTGFSFGNTSTPATTGQTTGFGSSTTGSGFGGNTGFNFGQPAATTTSTTTGFGSTTGSGFGGNTGFNFGQPAATTTQPNSFSFNLPQTNTQTGFGFGNQTINQPERNPVDVQVQQIFDQYNPKMKSCRFTHFFYNLPRDENKDGVKLPRPLTVEDERNLLLKEWSTVINPDVWNEAQTGSNNPDPQKYYAVPARSFSDVRDRVTVQQERTERMIQTLQLASTKLDKLKQKEARTQNNVNRVKEEHLRLYMRVLSIQRVLEVLMQKGQPLNSDDVALRNYLTSLLRELQKPSQYRGRLNELKPQLNYHLSQPMMVIDDKSVSDEETMKNVHGFLVQQTQGLAKLMDVINKDTTDVAFVTKQLQTVRK
ncbi:nuclear pore complex protein Nup54 [Acrasis kona]|uniref:Nuclear pore complex protein Nup54 n=1 Tax=Acrasis kona TaxID=1008807 RepID=A0AAW2YUK7_9EUKA